MLLFLQRPICTKFRGLVCFTYISYFECLCVVLSPYSTKNRVCVGYSLHHLTHEMYMPNAKTQCQDPTPPIFHWLASGVCVGANANFGFGIGGLASGNAKKLRQLTQNIPTCWYILRWVTQKSGVGCIAQRQPPTPGILRSGGI